jgi:hypothetical protein
MARALPKKGFYVWNANKWADTQKLTQEQRDRLTTMADYIDVTYYCNGTTKGNFYYDPVHHSDQWNFLTWTCVPSVKDAADHYDYHETNPTDKPLPEPTEKK